MKCFWCGAELTGGTDTYGGPGEPVMCYECKYMWDENMTGGVCIHWGACGNVQPCDERCIVFREERERRAQMSLSLAM